MIRLLLDEHIPASYQSQIIRHSVDAEVWRIGDEGAPPRGAPDPELLNWCSENGFMLVTNNRKSMPAHLRDHLAEGRHIRGILTIDSAGALGPTIDSLLIYASASTEEELCDRITFVTLL